MCIWDMEHDEYRFNKGLFAGLNIPFKPQSPHRLYLNYLIDKTTLSEERLEITPRNEWYGWTSNTNNWSLFVLPWEIKWISNGEKTKRYLRPWLKNFHQQNIWFTHEIEKDTVFDFRTADGHETHLTEKGEIIITNIILSL